jgi:hypothetical protein
MRRSLRDPAWLAAVTARRAPPFAADLRVWVDPDDIDGAKNTTLTSGGVIGTIANKGTLGGTFVGTTGGRPTFQPTAGAGGGPCMRFANTAGACASSLPASSFAFMHDGSGCTIYSVFKTSVSQFGTIVATSTGAGTIRGIGFRVSTTFRAGIYVSNGTLLIVNFNSANNVMTSGLHHVLSGTIRDRATGNDAEMFVEGVSVGGAAAGSAFSALAPAGTLTIGRTSADANRLIGDLGDLLIYAADHDATQRNAVAAYLTSARGAFPQ